MCDYYSKLWLMLCCLHSQKESNYVGRIFYCLKPVSSHANMMTLNLYSHSAKHIRGSLQVLLSVNGAVSTELNVMELHGLKIIQDAEKGSMSVRLKEHRALLTKIVLHESKEVAI